MSTPGSLTLFPAHVFLVKHQLGLERIILKAVSSHVFAFTTRKAETSHLKTGMQTFLSLQEVTDPLPILLKLRTLSSGMHTTLNTPSGAIVVHEAVLLWLETKAHGTERRPLCPRGKLLRVYLVKSCLRTLEHALPFEEWISFCRVRLKKSTKRVRVAGSGPERPLSGFSRVWVRVSTALVKCFVLLCSCAVKMLELPAVRQGLLHVCVSLVEATCSLSILSYPTLSGGGLGALPASVL